jgi:thiamine pyrophosphate-dependent acetolactate synthase large subunit-like protein
LSPEDSLPELAAYARAFGAVGLTVRRTAELADAFQVAASADRLTVIDVKTDPAVSPRFVEPEAWPQADRDGLERFQSTRSRSASNCRPMTE